MDCLTFFFFLGGGRAKVVMRVQHWLRGKSHGVTLI